MRSSSLRFALSVSGVFALAALVAGGISYDLQSRDLAARLQADVRRLAQSLSRTQDPQDLAEEIAALTATAPDASLIVAWQREGQSLGNVAVPTHFSGAQHLLTSRDLRLLAPIPDPPEGYFAFGAQVAGGWLVVGRDDAWLAENAEILLQTSAWGLGAALVLTVALALAVARRNETRILRMQSVLDAVAAGDHSRRIDEAQGDDLGRVARDVDRTLDRLEAGIAALRQVSTDIAHDLRAPLSRLRLRLDSVPGAAQAVAELDALSATFDAILRLSRLQSGTVPLEEQRLDLATLAAEIVEIFEPTPSETGHSIGLAASHPVWVSGDRGLLLQALVNLVENAIRHTPPGAIDLQVTAEGQTATLAICDHGPGIPEADRARVLQRFVRLDPSRSTPGAGLGLSMAAAIAAQHRGTLALEDNSPGLRAVLRLPIADG